ncbi:MAG: 6,7-dimethyl-8-ribityllumazine synthase [Patescibacteria group bacterium]
MNKRVAIVLGQFHKVYAERMLVEAKTALLAAGLEVISEVWVPGSLEKPLALKRLLLRSDIDGAVVLGIIERGETKHGLVMGEVVMQAIVDLQLQTMKPVGVGILGPEILPDQIEPRLLPYAKAAAEALGVMLK